MAVKIIVHRLTGRISGATGIASFCSCGLSFFGRTVFEADKAFERHVPNEH